MPAEELTNRPGDATRQEPPGGAEQHSPHGGPRPLLIDQNRAEINPSRYPPSNFERETVRERQRRFQGHDKPLTRDEVMTGSEVSELLRLPAPPPIEELLAR